MSDINYILNRYSIDNLYTTIYNNFYIDNKPIYNYDGSIQYLIKLNKKYKYKNNLLYILYKNNIIYLVNYHKINKKYDYYEIMKDIYIDYRIFDIISAFG